MDDRMQITVLGNGGCINEGLAGNAFLINKDFLVEAPPDIYLSLRSQSVVPESLKYICISHLHGDHTFGLPFLLINIWYNLILNKTEKSLTIMGPEGIRQHCLSLMELAFSKEHPCYLWIEDYIVFRQIDEKAESVYEKYNVSFFSLEHLIPTYGLRISYNNSNLFSYIADTRWCSSVESVLKENPRAVLIDANSDNNKVHVSYNDILENGLSISGSKTVYYCTHLYKEFESTESHIICAIPGLTFFVSV